MLKGLLKNETCGECRICCGFDRTDIWEMPVMNEKSKDKLSQMKSETQFLKNGDGFTVKAPELIGDELFLCPALDTQKGCILGEDKPFDCKIWPYRVMELSGNMVISICTVCNELYNRPLKELVEFLNNGLAKKIYEYALEHPEIIKKYDYSYPILNVYDG
jgi:Fe-S-cluster containining protein